jgi:ABA DEFICIENT 4-like
MDADSLFTLCNLFVLPGWILLAVAPRWKWSASFVAPLLIPALLALVYLVLVLSSFGTAEGSFSSLTGVASLFDDPDILLAGWIHYLAFDLFIGAWEVRDAQALGLSHAYVLPCLILTFFFGPIGLLLYLLARAFFKGRFEVAAGRA